GVAVLPRRGIKQRADARQLVGGKDVGNIEDHGCCAAAQARSSKGMGTITRAETAWPACLAGVKRQRLTAASAALSSRSWPLLRNSRRLSTVPAMLTVTRIS